MNQRVEAIGKRAVNAEMAARVDKRRKANIRLAIVLGLIAFGFYLLMIFLNPL